MKRLFFALLIILLLINGAAAEESAWNSAPVITHAYELEEGKIHLEWEAYAPVYQIYMDGKNVANTIVTNTVLKVKKGSHTIQIYPVFSTKSADTTVGMNLGDKYFDLDLAAFGIDPKTLTAGIPSDPLRIDYTPGTLSDAKPTDLIAQTDPLDRVMLTFTDRYYADEYLLTIKMDKDVNYVRFNIHEEDAKPLITRSNALVTLVLDPAYLQSHKCIVPEPDEEYTFVVQLRKYAQNMVNGQPITTVYQESEESKKLHYTPVALWKNAPVITYASQTADAQVTLRWAHEDYGRDCEYAVLRFKKRLGVRYDTALLTVTKEKSVTLNDLEHGEYYFTVAPVLNHEEGEHAEEIEIDVQNDWILAPAFTCEQISANQVRLTWDTAKQVDYYQLVVYRGDDDSLLRFIFSDFKKIAGYNLSNTKDRMEFIFTYADTPDPQTGEKLMFELCGVRITNEQFQETSAFSTQIFRLKP